MARPRRVDMAMVAQAQALAVEGKTVDDLRCAQAVLLPGLLGATLEQTAAVLGVGRATVPRFQSRLRDRWPGLRVRNAVGGPSPSGDDPGGGALHSSSRG